MDVNMNLRVFARKWLEKEGLFDKDADYGGWLAQATMEVVELIAKQGHSGHSGPMLIELLKRIYEAYETSDHPIWKEYWESPEGKALVERCAGIEVASEH
jgi:hypothetical protein